MRTPAVSVSASRPQRLLRRGVYTERSERAPRNDSNSAVVLLSAGLDSAVNIKCALDRGPVAAALTFDYGQRAVARELSMSAAICRRFGVRHEKIRLPWYRAIAHTALVDSAQSLPHPTAAQLDDLSAARKSAARVWAPNRNGIFLAVAAAFAESLGARRVVAGFNAEEAATFPDNSEAFMRAATQAMRFSTSNGVRVVSYTARLRKPQIVRLGLKINAPMDLVWCCYEGDKRLCGRCESCRRFLRAIDQADAAAWFAVRHKLMPRSGICRC